MSASRKKPVITVERIESHIDMLARIMHRAGRDAEKYLPIWRALHRERDARLEKDTLLAAAQERFRQLSDRTEERSAAYAAASTPESRQSRISGDR